MKSITQAEKTCYICGKETDLHDHHVFGGPNRKLSEKYGLKIWLCLFHHMGDINGNHMAVHHNEGMMRNIRRTIQKKAMEYYDWTTEDFIRIFGKNYL